MDRWAYANPWKWSAAVGIVMFLTGWLVWGRMGTRLGLMAGVTWGAMFFVSTAVQMCSGKARGVVVTEPDDIRPVEASNSRIP